MKFHSSVFSAAYLSETCQQAKQGSQDVLLLQLLLGDPKTFLGQMGYVIPPACSGSVWGLLSVGVVPGKPLEGGVLNASQSDTRITSTGSL